jgi:hypothetical protein
VGENLGFTAIKSAAGSRVGPLGHNRVEFNSNIIDNPPLSNQLIIMADENKPSNSEIEDSDIQTNWDECTTTFDAMDLKEDLLRGIYAYGFEKPSAIQQVRVCYQMDR